MDNNQRRILFCVWSRWFGRVLPKAKSDCQHPELFVGDDDVFGPVISCPDCDRRIDEAFLEMASERGTFNMQKTNG
tara:strand:+ start:149 stop:376 length:228 start_codon:yes stop_codon:yes gene_type:complete